ncbi:molybdate transport system permease protein [Endobacter medicaginis]|uniref:Molybdate transport system permease protein n=1 Tax=Endobacter medicaginis TaxID=1181271 RepID=A0A839V3I9_9PROT|nr:ABC transporter permease subunit [Endobacter medicaginis]MBB3175044.1 molybdate transport system permease protein [Endobacter medicaginis]MCX5476337.1 ABC transporter permease subunit [Endobacter medicaginis]
MDTPLASVVWLTLQVAAGGVALALPFALACAICLSGPRRVWRVGLDALVHLPLVLPPVVVGWGLLVVFGTHGPLGAPLARIGLPLVFTRAGAILATAVMILPLITRAIRLSLDGLDPGLLAAARTLGAAPLDAWFCVVLPLASPGILAGAVIGFAAALGEFGAVITFAANIPGQTQTLPLAIYTALQDPEGDAVAARLALVAAALAVGLLLVAGRLESWLRRRVNG